MPKSALSNKKKTLSYNMATRKTKKMTTKPFKLGWSCRNVIDLNAYAIKFVKDHPRKRFAVDVVKTSDRLV